VHVLKALKHWEVVKVVNGTLGPLLFIFLISFEAAGSRFVLNGLGFSFRVSTSPKLLDRLSQAEFALVFARLLERE
jgi:hypothetical protein